MKSMLFAGLMLPALFTSALAAAPEDLGRRLADGYARPAMTALNQQASALHGQLQSWCQKPDAAGARQVDAAFGALAQAWSRVAFLRFGPLVQGNRFERLSFWPDTRGVMPRQVQSILAAADPAVLADGALAARSVAVQGLPALEFMLYADPALLKQTGGDTFAYGCQFATAVAANVKTLSGELQQAWSAESEFGRQFTQPAKDNDLYRSRQEVAAEAMKALSTGLQFARDVNLVPVLGADAQAARPKRAAFWRSGQTAAALAASLQGMRAFYVAGGYSFAAGSQGLADTLKHELDQAGKLIASVPADAEQAFTAEEPRSALTLAVMVLKNAKDVVDQDIAPALGVTIGFNALDGD